MSRGQFLSELVMREHGDDEWVLVEPLVYVSGFAKQTFTVPAGFVTDLASVPRLPVVFWLTGATSNKAAVIHDFLYETKPVSRKIADEVLAEASKATGEPAWRRGLMWLGVRVGGKSRWLEFGHGATG